MNNIEIESTAYPFIVHENEIESFLWRFQPNPRYYRMIRSEPTTPRGMQKEVRID